MVVKDAYLEGQKYTKLENLSKIMNAKVGQPIFSIDLDKVRGDLEDVSWIKYAAVERQLPSTINIQISERQPVALWQYKKKAYLIDIDGYVIKEPNLAPFSDLIIIVGKNAPVFARSLLTMIERDDDIRTMVSSAIRVNERRWNVRLHNDVEIKLPEEEPEVAWEYLINQHKKNHILDSKIKTIDLRLPGKMYINKKT
ncbi:FtsQ-type POTRA domain-containing protein [Rickettsiales bacterium]|nr:FtsQ-type POTRA domain-containing protein [Rickettsiales bacterium]